MSALLEVDGLCVDYATSKGQVRAVGNVSFTIAANEVLGIAGESGCGKSTLLKSLLRLLPSDAAISARRLAFAGRDLMATDARTFRRELLWQKIAFVPQGAMASLNPVITVGAQIAEAIRAHVKMPQPRIDARIAEMCDAVGLHGGVARLYPHQLSGGMRQRAMIAMALVLDPQLIIMDEPTTGLDVLVQQRILETLADLRRRVGCSILLVTHDIAVLAEACDRIAIMYAGGMMEIAPAAALFAAPWHPYTLGLQNAFPSILDPGRQLISIPGRATAPSTTATGCQFAPRCPFALPICTAETPAPVAVGPNHLVACHRIGDVDHLRARAPDKATWRS